MKKTPKKVIAVMAEASMTSGIIATTSIIMIADNNVGSIDDYHSSDLGKTMDHMKRGANFLSRKAFERRLDTWIADGFIRSRDKEFMLDRFDWCSTYSAII